MKGTWARIAGLDILSEQYAYAEDPEFGHVAASRVADRWVRTTCGYCSVGCGMLVGVRDGKAVAARGDSRHPVNRGKLCPKGLSEHHTLSAEGRARYPLLRKRGRLERVSWDEALDTMVARTRGLGDALGVISTGQLVTEEFYALGKLVQLGFGTSNYDGNTTLCMSSAVSGYKRSFGSDGPPGCYDDLAHADVIFLIGANIADNHPILCQRLEENPNATLIVADPRVTKTAMMADIYLPLRPRSDIALLNGIAHILIRDGLIRRDYIADHTTGFEELHGFVQKFPPARVAELTGLEEHQIEQAAMLYGRAKAAFIGWTMGVNHSTQGTETVNAINNLALLTGNIGRAGAAPFSITGQCNAMGTREAGFASSLPGYRKFESQNDREELAALWDIDAGRIPTARGLAYPDIIEAALARRIRALWIVATNPVVSFPNHDVLQQALETVEFLVVQDGFHPTPTTEYADLVLPAAIWGEKEGTYTNSERRVSKVNRAVAPPGEARPDFDIFLDLAARLGVGDELFPGWQTPRDAFEEWRRISSGRLCDYSAMTWETIEERGGIQWGGERLYRDGEFPSPGGRARLFCIEWQPFPEQPCKEYPLILNTGRTVEHWHTRTKTGAVPILEGMSPRAWLEMNPRDARKLGLRAHDRVNVLSRRSSVEDVELRVTEIVASGQVFMPFHFVETNSNLVTQSAFDPISREPNFKQCAVRVQKTGVGGRGSGVESGGVMEDLVVVGNGMAGVACLEQILKHSKKFNVTVFGDETHVNYNRILLSSVLAGERTADDIAINSLEWYQQNDIALRLGVRIVDVNPKKRTIKGDDGSVTHYDKLLLATGSKAFIPPIEGVAKENVFTFRNLDDTRAMMAAAGPGVKAVVIGGGLLGLEAARGLQLQGCDVTVVHLLDTLMNMQLDAVGGRYLQRKMEHMGVKVLTSRSTKRLLGNGHVEGVAFEDSQQIEADIVVIAAGIRPNADLGIKAGLEVKRGIVVNDYMETSDPRIFAVGECVEHNGQVYGLVAPLFEQGKVLAATITGNKGPQFAGWKPAAKLKIMGVDVFSAGEFEEREGTEVVRYEDPAMGIYKKLLVRGNRLAGVVLVGDAADSNRYMDWLRNDTDLIIHRRNLLFPEPEQDRGLSVAEMADSETVCGCTGVSKGTIIQAIHQKGVRTLAQLKECTRASTGCGSCTGMCEQILKAVAPDFVEDTKKVLCKCVPFSQESLREIIRSQRLKSVQQVLDIYGDGIGCEVCKPALSYLVDVVWCGEHEEDRSARFINDRVHANIQNDGTFSVVPRIRGGVTSPAELRKIADVAEKYNARMVKITGSQRIDLLGIQKADLPKVWADLGMPSGQAYTKGVRMVKTCVGTEFCRYGVQDAILTGIELERRLENLYTPHKTKMAVTGCPRNCSEATVKDIGLVGQEGSWQIVVGGAAGKTVRKADLLVTVKTTDEALDAAMLFFQYYRENANFLERTYDFVERVGIERVRKETVYATASHRRDLLKRLQKSKALSRDAWLERQSPVHPTQFVQIQPLEARIQ